MYICIRVGEYVVRKNICMYVRTYVCIYVMCVSMHLTYMYVCICMYYVCMCIMYVSTYILMYVCMFICNVRIRVLPFGG